MLEIRPIQDGDMAYIRENPFEEVVKVYPELHPTPETSFTCVFDDEIVAVGGLRLFPWPGGGEVWLMLTKQSRKHNIFGLIALDAIQNKMNSLIKENKLWRAQAGVRDDFPEAIKMIEAFGFTHEGTQRQYTPDRCDMRMYGKLF